MRVHTSENSKKRLNPSVTYSISRPLYHFPLITELAQNLRSHFLGLQAYFVSLFQPIIGTFDPFRMIQQSFLLILRNGNEAVFELVGRLAAQGALFSRPSLDIFEGEPLELGPVAVHLGSATLASGGLNFPSLQLHLLQLKIHY